MLDESAQGLPGGLLALAQLPLMPNHGFFRIPALTAIGLSLSYFFCTLAAAQGPMLAVPKTAVEPSPFVSVSIPQVQNEHKFWDKTNFVLFSTSAALSVADFAVTRSNLQSGGRELNPVTRVFGSSTPGLAVNFAGENAGVIGISYFLHRTGHHKLERIASMVNIGASASAVSYGLTHR